MNDADDPLEAELASLRPYDVSPRLKQRIAECLDPSSPPRWRWLRATVLSGGLASACLVVILLVHKSGPGDPTRSDTVMLPSTPAGVRDDALPTLQVYQRALSGSPEALDSLLDKHAVLAARPDSPGGQVSAFARSHHVIHSLIGEP